MICSSIPNLIQLTVWVKEYAGDIVGVTSIGTYKLYRINSRMSLDLVFVFAKLLKIDKIIGIATRTGPKRQKSVCVRSRKISPGGPSR